MFFWFVYGVPLTWWIKLQSDFLCDLCKGSSMMSCMRQPYTPPTQQLQCPFNLVLCSSSSFSWLSFSSWSPSTFSWKLLFSFIAKKQMLSHHIRVHLQVKSQLIKHTLLSLPEKPLVWHIFKIKPTHKYGIWNICEGAGNEFQVYFFPNTHVVTSCSCSNQKHLDTLTI